MVCVVLTWTAADFNSLDGLEGGGDGGEETEGGEGRGDEEAEEGYRRADEEAEAGGRSVGVMHLWGRWLGVVSLLPSR